jgi:hypothetical protein
VEALKPSLALFEVAHFCNYSATEATEITEKLAHSVSSVFSVASLP